MAISSNGEIYAVAEKILENILKRATDVLNPEYEVVIPISLSQKDILDLDVIISVCESRKAILTVLITLLAYKVANPSQDIRNHQANIENGFSGRTFDTQVVTPFMKKHKFPAMVESGWLTRSLEQNRPYNFEYSGKITPVKARVSFLTLLNSIEVKDASAQDFLLYLFQKLIIYREKHKIELIVSPLKDRKVSIQDIITILERHFTSCAEVGKARLPVLALYAIYECIIDELERYKDKSLRAIESHTSADARSGGIGDIDVLNVDGTPFEGVEVKYGKPITAQMILDAYEKFKIYPVNRYYLLSTEVSDKKEKEVIENVMQQISAEHGCQIIVNGIIQTIKYYLRLINDTNEFIDKYAYYIEIDDVIKLEHKQVWNQIVKEFAFNQVK